MPLDITPDLAPLADLIRPRLDIAFPGFRAALLTGSVVRGTATATSDVDVVLLLPDGASGCRETVEWQCRPCGSAAWARTVDIFGYDDAKRTARQVFEAGGCARTPLAQNSR